MNKSIDAIAVSAAFSQPGYDGRFTGAFADYLRDLGKRRPVLIFAFAPKAAGTFLRTAAIAASDGQLVRIVHAQGGRDAQPYLPIFIDYYLGGVCKGPLVAHVHMQALPANRYFLEAFGIKPVIMLRSIPDMLASYWDMLSADAQARAEGLNCPIPDGFPDFDAAKKADFMIDMIAPWYIDYFATWLTYANEKPDDVCVLSYADFTDDPAEVLQTALEHVDLPRSRQACQAALDGAWKDRGTLRFNKGKGGRGKAYFSQEHLDRLARMLRYHPVLESYSGELL
jgi:Sulfotransferase domain